MTARPLPEQWREPIEAWCSQLRQDGFAAGTIRDRQRAVRRAAQAFAGSPWDLTADRLEQYADQQAWNALTRGTWLRTVRLFYEFALQRGWTGTVPTRPRYAALVRQPAATIWSVELEAWARYLAASGQSTDTIKQRRYQLRRLACAFPQWGPWDLTLEDLTGFLGSLEVGKNTLRVARQSLRAFYRWGASTGRIREDPSAELPGVRPRRAHPRPAPEYAIREALDGADDRTRDAIELGAIAGLRRSEIARVHTRDVVRYTDGWEVHVTGKGGEQRKVPLSDELGERLASRPHGYVFPNGRGGHLAPAYLGALMRRRLPDRWTPHTLRHRFATRAYTAERDIMVVRDLLGHANVQTTQIYTAIPGGARRAAADAAAIVG